MFNFYPGYIHHKIKKNMNKGLLNSDIKVSCTKDLSNSKYIYSASTFIDPSLYPNKKFIFGPQFAIFPKNLPKFNNKYRNAIYIVPSNWVKEFWKKTNYNSIPLHVYPVGVDTDYFKPKDIIKDNVFVYYKRRSLEELNYLKDFLDKQPINYKIFDYDGKYKEVTYLNYLQTCKFGVWLGCHESQGFALLEALSTNVPLLVWNVNKLSQELNCPKEYYNVNSPATTIPYWDDTCGMYFYNKDELESSYNKFITILDTYKPRQYVVNNLSLKKQTDKLMQLFSKF